MKIVSFGDAHMAIGQMNKIALELATSDLVILSGDLTTFGAISLFALTMIRWTPN